MEIKRENTVLCDVYLKDNSYTVEEVMGEDTLTLNFLSRNVVELQINDYINLEGTKYKIRHNEKVTKRETSLGWEYNVMFYSSKYDLMDVEFFLHGAPERKKNFDYYTGTARDWLGLFVKNMNRSESGWVIGSCIESRMITLSFKDKKVGTVLDELVKELNSEYWISGKTMNIGKREYSSNGLVLAQGEGMGFTELEVSAVDDAPPITVLYPYGSDKNIGPDYGSDYLLLPGGQLSIEKNVEKYGRIEKSMPFDHIFPKGEFTVTEKIDNFTLKASGIDFNLTDCLIDDVEVIVTFQNGGLAGYDLAIVEGSWDNSIKQFKLKQNDQENALKVPGDINFSVGDKFILTGLRMPQSYIDKASQQLSEESQDWLDEHCEKRIQLKGKCDKGLFRQLNLFIACGQMVGVYSEQLKIDREIRVTRVKRYIENNNKPSYRYELTLSDFLQGNGFKDLVDDVNKVPDEIDSVVRPFKEWTKRSWKDVMQTFDMMFDPEGEYFTEKIKPLAVHTAQLVVGTNSQQMDLVGIRFSPNADNDPNYFKWTSGKLVHFTIQEDSVREWSISSSSARLSNTVAYYVYAKCPKVGTAGSIIVSDQKIKLESVSGYYHFWVGVLNTPDNSVRSWIPNYGYTEIAGQTITTGIIKDKNANIVIDLNKGTFTGYGNFTDKPDLSVYAYQSELKVTADQISATATKLNTLTNRVDSAGWITRAEGNRWWASSDLEDGNTIISYINQTATTTVISSNRINLRGAVTIQMFDPDLKAEFNRKADYSDITSALSSYATITAASGYAASESKAIFDKLTDAMINGKTTVLGGLISAKVLDVDSIFANQATIGNFRIVDGQIQSAMSSSLGSGSFIINPNGGLYFNVSSNIYARMGPATISISSGYRSLLTVCHAAQGMTSGTCAFFLIGRAQYSDYPQTWINCGHADGWGWGSRFIVESRYFNDTSAMERTVINVGKLMTKDQIKVLSSNPNLLPVYYDDNSGYLCLMY